MIAEGGTEVNLAVVSMIGTVLTGVVATIGAYLTQKAKADQEQHKALLDQMHAEVAGVKKALDDHVAWEMDANNGKYATPWDGQDRRTP